MKEEEIRVTDVEDETEVKDAVDKKATEVKTIQQEKYIIIVARLVTWPNPVEH